MNIAKNAIYNGVVQVSGMLLNLALMPYITRVLGPDSLGINSFGQAVTGYFVLLGNLGITIYGAKVIAENRDSLHHKQEKFSECISYQFFFNALSLILYNIWALTQPSPVYFLFNLIILTAMTDLSWVYTGEERFDLIAIRNLFIKFVGVGSVFLFVKDKEDLPLYIILQQGVLFISNIIYWTQLKKIDLSVKFSSLKTAVFNNIKPALAVFIPSIFTSLYLSFSKVMLGYMAPMDEVAIYDYPNRLIKVATTFIGILGTVMMPRLAYLRHNDKSDECVSKIHQMINVSLIFSVPVAVMMIMIASPLCNIFFSDSFTGTDVVLRIVAPTVITSGLSLYVIFVSLDRMRYFLKAVVVAGLLNLIVNFILIPHFNAAGAAISLLMSEMVVHAIMIYYLRDLCPVSWVLKTIIRYLLVNFIIVIPLYFVFGTIDTFEDILIFVSIYSVLYMLWLLIANRKYIKRLTSR